MGRTKASQAARHARWLRVFEEEYGRSPDLIVARLAKRWRITWAGAYDRLEALQRAGRLQWVPERRTACKWGHPFTPENTRTQKDGVRRCRVCEAVKKQRFYERHPEKLLEARAYQREYHRQKRAQQREAS